MLTGKYRRDRKPAKGTRFAKAPVFADIFINKQNFDRIDKLEKFCKARGKPLVELAFSWLLANPIVPSVIAGASTPQQVAQNAKSAGWRLSPDELAEIDKISPAPVPKVGH
jgi:aryl-alcohol dehydrogenase-like predicted oxidoreductase